MRVFYPLDSCLSNLKKKWGAHPRPRRDKDPSGTPEAVAALILAAATVKTPIREQLLSVRADFDVLVNLAKKHNWTDDTEVSQDVFGPMWPEGLTPDWAQESTVSPVPQNAPDPPAPPSE